ncbi:MAG: endonuclease/exonuclease/phosphatase family protein [Verrucomicrobiae bacterium]|nr:endonuclease/exonuclease/phosphatase family protein [Verrucomicrobiae bacterium]
MLRRLRQFFAVAIPTVLVLVLAVVLLCYLNRWDELVVITLIPMWAWASVGMLVSIIAWPTLKSQFSLFTFALWLIAGVALSDETAGLLREFRAAVAGGNTPAEGATEQPAPERLRIVTLNCGEGNEDATSELKKLEPDIVLLQEAPERPFLIDLTSELFGADGTFIRSEQCAILARGRLGDSFTEAETGSLVASLERPNGEQIDIVNIDLPRATPRFDIWNADCWQELIARRKANRRTLRKLLGTLPDRAGPEIQIVGGSFGAPPSDDLFRLLRSSQLVDSFRQSGFGWGNTFPGSVPVLRVDQIWTTYPFEPDRSETFSNAASDHRYVVSDFRRAIPAGKLVLAKVSK